MARDYVNRRGDRKPSQHEATRSKRGSMSPWVVTGVLIGIFIAGIIYFKMQHAHMFAEQMVESNQLPVQTSASVVEQKPNVSTKSPQPQFDFYTVLPKADKAIPVDNVTPVNHVAKSKPVNPAELLSDAAKNATPVIGVSTKTETVKKPSEKEPPVTTVALPPVAQNDDSGTVDAESHKPPVVEKQKLAQEIAIAAQQELPTQVSMKQQYILVLGTFKDYSGADGKRAQLALQSIEANIKEISKSGGKAYRVWIGPYINLKAAQKQQHHLQSAQVKSVLIKDE